MSAMGFPESIPLGGGGGGAEAAPAGGGGSDDPEELIRQAKDLVRRAIEAEPDQEDKMVLEDTASRMQKYLASQQKLGDSAMGAGPGVKLVRKAASRGGGGGGGGY